MNQNATRPRSCRGASGDEPGLSIELSPAVRWSWRPTRDAAKFERKWTGAGPVVSRCTCATIIVSV